MRGEPLVSEVITIKVENGIQHYDAAVQSKADSMVSMSKYAAQFNDGRWYPRMNTETGQALGDEVLLVKVDELTHYRIGRDKNGKASSLMMRRMAEDRKSYTATILNTNSEVQLVRVFERQ